MQDSYGGCGFTVDIPTLPVARAIPSRWILEPRAEGRGDNTKGFKQIKQLHKEQSCLWQYFLCPGRLGLMMAKTSIKLKRCPSVRASGTATAWLLLSGDQGHLLSPQSAHLPPLNQQGLDLASATERLKGFLQGKAVPDLFFLKNLLCFHCWRKPEPCV